MYAVRRCLDVILSAVGNHQRVLSRGIRKSELHFKHLALSCRGLEDGLFSGKSKGGRKPPPRLGLAWLELVNNVQIQGERLSNRTY